MLHPGNDQINLLRNDELKFTKNEYNLKLINMPILQSE